MELIVNRTFMLCVGLGLAAIAPLCHSQDGYECSTLVSSVPRGSRTDIAQARTVVHQSILLFGVRWESDGIQPLYRFLVSRLVPAADQAQVLEALLLQDKQPGNIRHMMRRGTVNKLAWEKINDGLSRIASYHPDLRTPCGFDCLVAEGILPPEVPDATFVDFLKPEGGSELLRQFHKSMETSPDNVGRIPFLLRRIGRLVLNADNQKQLEALLDAANLPVNPLFRVRDDRMGRFAASILHWMARMLNPHGDPLLLTSSQSLARGLNLNDLSSVLRTEENAREQSPAGAILSYETFLFQRGNGERLFDFLVQGIVHPRTRNEVQSSFSRGDLGDDPVAKLSLICTNAGLPPTCSIHSLQEQLLIPPMVSSATFQKFLRQGGGSELLSAAKTQGLPNALKTLGKAIPLGDRTDHYGKWMDALEFAESSSSNFRLRDDRTTRVAASMLLWLARVVDSTADETVLESELSLRRALRLSDPSMLVADTHGTEREAIERYFAFILGQDRSESDVTPFVDFLADRVVQSGEERQLLKEALRNQNSLSPVAKVELVLARLPGNESFEQLQRNLTLPLEISPNTLSDFLKGSGGSDILRRFGDYFTAEALADEARIATVLRHIGMIALNSKEQADLARLLEVIHLQQGPRNMLQLRKDRTTKVAASLLLWMARLKKPETNEWILESANELADVLRLPRVPPGSTVRWLQRGPIAHVLGREAKRADLSLHSPFAMERLFIHVVQDWPEDLKRTATTKIQSIKWIKSDGSQINTETATMVRIYFALWFLADLAHTSETLESLIKDRADDFQSWRRFLKLTIQPPR